MHVPYQDLAGVHQPVFQELEMVFHEVLNREWFIQGGFCEEFEKKFAEFCGRKYCIGVGNGLDALRVSLMSMDIGAGDEVIVPANTFIATVLAVSAVGAVPVLVDADLKTLNIDISKIEEKVSAKTKAIIAVHLYGRMTEMDKIMKLAQAYGLHVIEDAAQAHGAVYQGKRAGGYGKAAAFSFYPGKNLGALGDGGAIVTDDEELYRKAAMIKNYGSLKKYEHEFIGINSRLDELQAAFLSVKLNHLETWNQERRRVAGCYRKGICNKDLYVPPDNEEGHNVYHIFPVLCKERNRLKDFLYNKGIEAGIHYPKPIYNQEAYKYIMTDKNFPVTSQICGEELSLPVYPGMKQEQVDYVIDCVNMF